MARDHLRRAEHDLVETAAFIAGSLMMVTAAQAVIIYYHKGRENGKFIGFDTA